MNRYRHVFKCPMRRLIINSWHILVRNGVFSIWLEWLRLIVAFAEKGHCLPAGLTKMDFVIKRPAQ